jgi:hypothetical protein
MRRVWRVERHDLRAEGSSAGSDRSGRNWVIQIRHFKFMNVQVSALRIILAVEASPSYFGISLVK